MSNTDGREPPTLYLTPAHGDVWREDDVLVCTPGANLPPRCIKCNAPTDMPSRRYIFHWHHPVIYLALLMGVLPYVILAIALRKRSAHVLTLCAHHEQRRVRYVAITMASVLALLVCGLSLPSELRWVIGAGRDGGDARGRQARCAGAVGTVDRSPAGTLSRGLRRLLAGVAGRAIVAADSIQIAHHQNHVKGPHGPSVHRSVHNEYGSAQAVTIRSG